ncbi:hypothetical protein BH23GEM9_BH23GEM9_15660 [soil metagenome]
MSLLTSLVATFPTPAEPHLSSSPALETPRLRIVPDRRSTLPAPLTAFVGRDKALDAVAELVAGHRLVTLIGPGGSGKTRLAIEAGRIAADRFEDGVVWVELAPLLDANLVSQTLATALGIRHQPGRGADEAVAEYLANRRVLVVIDNCEHVVEAAADMAMTLLREAPHVHILATSRERLSVAGERTWPVPPLGLPPRRARHMDEVLRAEAVQLFTDRTAMVLPLFTIDAEAADAIAEICIRLDGIPLAIELAAARMNVLSPRQIADRLADSMALLTSRSRTLPKRQQTLRAAIDWSYALLSDSERVMFRRLSVFGCGFTLSAAEAVCADDVLAEAVVLDVLAGLVDKSLVAVRERDGEARYRLLETVRQYAREQLRAEGDCDPTSRRHAEYYCRIVADNGPLLRSTQRPRAIAIIDAELDNIRAALDWSRDTPGFGTLHHTIVAQLWWYWLHRVLWDEGVQRSGAAIAAASDDIDPSRLADTLYGGGVLAWVNGMFLQSRLWLEQAVSLRRGSSDPAALGLALCALGQALVDLGERDAALAAAREGMTLVRRGCSAWDTAVALATSYGYTHHASGLMDEAEQAYLEADALWSEPQDDWGRSLARNSIAVIAWRRGDLDRAQSFTRDALRHIRGVGDRWFASRTLQVLGYVLMQRNLPDHATRLLAASEALRREVGARLMPFEVPEWVKATEAARAALGDAAFDAEWNAGSAVDFHTAIDQALACGDADPATAAAPPPQQFVSVLPQPVATADHAAVAIRALGPLEIRRDGRALTNEDWTYAKPRELLFYLLSHGEGRTKEQIGLDLWPESPPARLRSSFHVTMHHLRRVLGSADWVAFHEGRYRFERIQPVEYDVERFEALLGDDARRGSRQAGRKAVDPSSSDPSSSDAANRMARLEEAVSLYRGDFLDDTAFGDWSLAIRDRLGRRFAAAAVELATLYLAAGRHDDAAETCRRLLARSNLDEAAHRLLMQAHIDAGRPADALRHYQIVVALFREELGIAPSAETVRLAESLTRSPQT